MFFPFELKGCTIGCIQLMRGETGFFQSSHSFEHHYILLELFLLRKKILKLLQHIVFQDFVAVGAMIVFLHNAEVPTRIGKEFSALTLALLDPLTFYLGHL